VAHNLKHSGVGPSFTLVKEWGESIDAPLHGRLLALPRLWSPWNSN
jgi:hypothetical protein